jgi:hypothetical protein
MVVPESSIVFTFTLSNRRALVLKLNVVRCWMHGDIQLRSDTYHRYFGETKRWKIFHHSHGQFTDSVLKSFELNGVNTERLISNQLIALR